MRDLGVILVPKFLGARYHSWVNKAKQPFLLEVLGSYQEFLYKDWAEGTDILQGTKETIFTTIKCANFCGDKELPYSTWHVLLTEGMGMIATVAIPICLASMAAPHIKTCFKNWKMGL